MSDENVYCIYNNEPIKSEIKSKDNILHIYSDSSHNEELIIEQGGGLLLFD